MDRIYQRVTGDFTNDTDKVEHVQGDVQEHHRLARREVYRRGPVGGLGVTTLLHEAHLSISGREGTVFADHARFIAYATRVMRRLIIDDVRRRPSSW